MEVLNQLIPISSKWYVIGVGLQVNVNYLESMANSKLSNQVKLGKVIQRWLDMDGQDEGAPVTWNALIDVIKGPLVQNKALALTIHAYLRLEDSRQQSGMCVYKYWCNIRGTSNKNYQLILYRT